jgi:hypothetical protein
MAFEDREMENVSAALVGLMKSAFELWSQNSPGSDTDSLAIECSRARAEFEQAMTTYVGARRGSGTNHPVLDSSSSMASETSVGDAPLVVPLPEAQALFEALYVMGAVALFDGNSAQAARALCVDGKTVATHLEHLRVGAVQADKELWSTVTALAQAGLEKIKRG